MSITNLTCTYQSILNHNLSLQQKCSQLSTVCLDQQFYVNFFEFYYCKLAGNWMYLLPLAMFMLLVIFVFLNSIMEQSVSPALIYISKFFRLPKQLSKITLLVFASNLDDFIASFMILKHQNQFGLFFGNLLGAVLFFLTAVLGICLKNVLIKVQFKSSRMIKDLGFLILFTLILGYFGYKKILDKKFCYIIIAIYIVQVLLEIKHIFDKKQQQKSSIENENDEENLELINNKDRSTRRSFHRKKMLIQKIRVLLNDYYDYMENKPQIRIENYAIEPYQKYLNFLDFPMKIIRYLTIPPSNEKSYSHDLTIIWPFGGIYFVIWFFFPIQKWQIFIMPICLGISILFCKYNSGNVDDIPRYFILMTFISVFISVIWMKIVFGILIDFLVFVNIITNIKGSIIGFTIITWICALPEALTLLSIFKRQNCQLAFQGFLQSKITSLILNFGFVLLYYININHNYEFNLFESYHYIVELLLIIFVFLSGVFILLYGLKNKMVFREVYTLQLQCYQSEYLLNRCTLIKLFSFKSFKYFFQQLQQMNYLEEINIKQETETIKENQKQEQFKKF